MVVLFIFYPKWAHAHFHHACNKMCVEKCRGIFFQNVEKVQKIDGLENRINLSITYFEKNIWTHPSKYGLYKGTLSKQKSMSNWYKTE